VVVGIAVVDDYKESLADPVKILCCCPPYC
jgi:hypothetical protein